MQNEQNQVVEIDNFIKCIKTPRQTIARISTEKGLVSGFSNLVSVISKVASGYSKALIK
jgi:hypothetical protein